MRFVQEGQKLPSPIVEDSLYIKERVDSEMKISSIMSFTFFSWPERSRSRWPYAGPWMLWCRSVCSDSSARMQVLECSQAGPRMLWCRSLNAVMQVHGCANFRDRNTVVESSSTLLKNQSNWLNMWTIIQPLKSFHFWVDPFFKICNKCRTNLAPNVGLEPTTLRFRFSCSNEWKGSPIP